MKRHESPGDERAGEGEPTRRSFLGILTVGALGLSAGVMALFNLVFLRPRVTLGPPSRFRIGRPEAYASGSQVEIPDQKVVVRREENRFAAISTICTHLGCTVNSTEIGFECPCHGSVYDRLGGVINGPAPLPLTWYRIMLAPNGELEVDKRQGVEGGTYFEVAS